MERPGKKVQRQEIGSGRKDAAAALCPGRARLLSFVHHSGKGIKLIWKKSQIARNDDSVYISTTKP
ncbi:hypothetical protein DQX05_02315 [Paenibacillus thiaminolyticus]|uniref:Uncharacterized protein n=1 Tax=Paenibacillus thiaminolyticus TaxID=49283 RepID=A0A3A3H9F3_PANTH|nr:hypothetical protein DQX05_02315 [Paenibacillus thiaminolyticus]